MKTAKSILNEFVTVFVSSLLFAAGLSMFLVPSEIVLGGMTGIATVLNIFFGTPVGAMIIILNIPLVIVNTYFSGREFLTRTLIGITASSVAVDAVEILNILPIPALDPLICAILGGAAVGAGTGILLSRGYTTGGTDLVACLVKLKFKRVSTGTLIAAADIVIIVGAAIATRSFNGLFYSLICTWAMGKVLDVMLSGARRAGQAFIFTSKPDELTAQIFKHLDRGVTIIDATGSFTGEKKPMLMCVVAKNEVFYLKQLIAKCDPDAFFIIADAAEVGGEGFKRREAAQ